MADERPLPEDWRERPERGMVIVARTGYGVARRIIQVYADGSVETTGYSGNQRNSTMRAARLRAYDLVGWE